MSQLGNSSVGKLLTGDDMAPGIALPADATAVTAPQFDNDVSLATTAFVQRALGNFQVGLAVTAATTLTAADSGKSFVFGGASSYSITLPLLSDVPDGAAYFFVSDTALATVTLQRQGSDLINMSHITITSIAVSYGDSLVLVKAAGTWRCIGGSVQLGYASVFGSSLAASGYQKLPSGLIVQWGYVIKPSAAAVSVTWPVAFPNGFGRCIAAFGGSGNPTDGVSTGSPGLTGATFYSAVGGGGYDISYVAIGW